MIKFVWNEEKALALQTDNKRGRVGFEECVYALENGKMIADILNPCASYPHQRIFIVDINNYAYAVPYLPDDDEVFFKNCVPKQKIYVHLFEGQN